MHPFLNTAVRAARRAGDRIAQAVDRLDLVKVDQKAPNDFVSDIDRQAEALIIDGLRRAYPEHGFLGEEGGLIEGTGAGKEHVWIIDPIDGTTNFLHGIPHFAVSIALRIKGQVEHGVVLDPIKREEFTASRGGGASLNGKRIRVSQCKGLQSALVATGIPFRNHTDMERPRIDSYFRALRAVADATTGVRRAGSAALDLAYVAAGRYDAYWEYGIKEWDIAAGALMVQEAGGLVSDHSGGNGYRTGGEILCGAPKCHLALLEVLRESRNPQTTSPSPNRKG